MAGEQGEDVGRFDLHDLVAGVEAGGGQVGPQALLLGPADQRAGRS